MNKGCELTRIDRNGEELELLGTGTWTEMAELMEETQMDNEDAGGDWLDMMIRAA